MDRSVLDEPTPLDQQRGPSPRRSLWCAGVLLVWLVLLAGWTVALLTPDPVRLAQEVLPAPIEFPAAKFLHVSVYAVLAATVVLLRPLGRYRWLLLVVLSLHGMGTEYFQQFVELRYPSVQDVLIDHAGIALGVVLAWWTGWGRART